MNSKNICKFCRQQKKLIRAHIIPRHFYLDYKDEQYVSVNSLSGKFKIQQCGAYDKNILCKDCDAKIIGKFDKEGYRILFDEIKKHKLKNVSDDIIYYLTSKDYNFEYLRNFFISILWRASISFLPDFKDINLGEYQQKALEILQGKKSYDNLFKIFIFKYPEGKDFNKLIFLSKAKFYNRKAYVINMAGYFITIILNGKNLIFNNKLHYIIESNRLYLQHYHFANKKMQEMWMKGYKPPFAPKIKN